MQKKIIVIDLGNDRSGSFMKDMLDDGAFSPGLSGAIEKIMGSVYPADVPCGSKQMWPGVGFPVADPMHAILNYIYATSQRPIIPQDVMGDMRREVSNVMEVNGGFGEDMKQEVLAGSKKVYNRTLEDGTEIKVEVTAPVEKTAEQELAGLFTERNRKQAAAETALHNSLRIDMDKVGRRLSKLAGLIPELKKDLDEVISKVATSVTIPAKGNESLIVGYVRKIAEAEGSSEEKVIKEVAADEDSDAKVMIYGELFDKRKFSKYPFDSYDNAVKAVGKQVAELICSKSEGNVKEEELKGLEDAAPDNPVIGRVLDRLTPILEYKNAE